MARSQRYTFGPGSLESLTLRVWSRNRSYGAIVCARLEGLYTVYCGAGNSHTVEISERLEASRGLSTGADSLDGLAIRIRDTRDSDAALQLASELVGWSLEDWFDPCDTGDADSLEDEELDTASSASRQHYIDTGEYLRVSEAWSGQASAGRNIWGDAP